ncbi:uncharacterized protein PITG_01202 [Phytophthora infestans T30-4]|uniref:Uncharacterized protein n=1 Tax=Phytophthora infestans (strain T30-4) TaxID=403677 RepID=D0MUW5_PHYIT|nr:uncharacterized protein PITG_01202 [Phytophthora infestans T30-4]EEY60961.1 conserved hypothetical protein [Phytophthora infestans T30-4]|eukprot:XP_002907878.1 conserved hypothetical protein [Phytophthora infestans T30-4]
MGRSKQLNDASNRVASRKIGFKLRLELLLRKAIVRLMQLQNIRPVPEASAEYATCRQLAVVTLCQAINQLDRYSKSTANRIVSGLTRIAAARREDIHPIANELMEPLLPAMLDGSQWGKFLRLRTEAIATVLVGCAESDDFRVENHPWISDFISFLLDPVVSSENVHSFLILLSIKHGRSINPGIKLSWE